MGLIFDESFEKNSYGLIKSGNYEVVIDKAIKKVTTSTNKPYLSLTYRIRSEVEGQEFAGRCIFDTLWLDNNENYAREGWYDTRKINKIIKTQPNPKIDFEDVDECILYLTGLHLVIGVETVMDDANGCEKNQLVKDSYKPSSWDLEHCDAVDLPRKETASMPTQTVSEDELPW